MTTIVFRCDASSTLGAGHVARCLALADAFAHADYKILFVTRKGSVNAAPNLTRYNYVEIEGNEAVELDRLGSLADANDTTLVLDHRERHINYEKACRRFASRILVITDFPDRPHDCDALVDQTIGRQASEYVAQVPKTSTVLTGSQYALVGKSFVSLRDQAKSRRKAGPAQRILLTFGATDPFNYLGRLLPALLEHARGLKIDIAAGSRPLDDIKAVCDAHANRISVLRAPNEMPGAILETDLAVGLAGASAWERCVLGLPSALFIPSDYHLLATERLAATGAAQVVGGNDFEPAHAVRRIVTLAQDEALLTRMSDRAFALCDGNGAARIVNAVH
ncbi:MAG: UDP-2,4-diacetamido-2,4,6-trideoxy-beta-L-altropyranose hydrolase [Rhizobiales bacterium]|nr:UDP-2,4-diacetamido-2,4,6-trideoxy-beta-L-altropyranose hydrolase [Hyphomicrobiales bacterium]